MKTDLMFQLLDCDKDFKGIHLIKLLRYRNKSAIKTLKFSTRSRKAFYMLWDCPSSKVGGKVNLQDKTSPLCQGRLE